MATIPAEQALLTRDHRLRRWIIRISLSLLLIMLILTVAGLMLLSSYGMTAQEAEANFVQLNSASTREDAKRLLGKPHSEVTSDDVTNLTWQYYTHGINHVELYYCILAWDQHDLLLESNSFKAKIEGGEAWRWRWNKLKERLGMK